MNSAHSTELAVQIRPAGAGDAERIGRVLLDSAELHASLDPERYAVPAVKAMLGRYHDARHIEGSISFIAELGSEIVGFIEARLEESPDPMHREIVYCHIAEIAVSTRLQNQGIGGRLLRAAEQWGRRQGAQFASLEYHAANIVASSFYRQRMGYRPAAITAIKRL